ncbi:MAG: hypothetical protein JXP37_08005 [Coriobacteriia bacterium]|nr:hypothetical protein [Coriobacteriia bacterium]
MGAEALDPAMFDTDPELVEEPEPVEDDEDLPWFLRSSDALTASLIEKKEEFFNALQGSNLVGQWRRAWSQYYGTDPDNPSEFATQNIKRVGPEKEYTRARINDFRSFVKQTIQTALGPAPAYKATTKSTDFATLAGIETIDRALSHVMGQTMTDRKRRRLLERAVVLGMSFGHARWDRDGGDDTTEKVPMKNPDGSPLVGAMNIPVTEDVEVKTGIPVIDIGSPWQTFYDPEEEEDLPWQCVMERRSKWDLAAQFEEQREEIIGCEDEDEYTREKLFGSAIFSSLSTAEDVVTLHHFYLARCAAAPEGRYVGFIEGVPALWDGPLPIQSKGRIPVVTIMPSAYIGAFLGYADCWDWMSIQQLIDNVVSDWASNVRAFGRLTLLNPKGSGVNMDALAKGNRAVDFNGQTPPHYLAPPKMDGGVDLTNYLHRRMESVSQQNAVRRGDPQANIKSGTMAALFNQISIEFLSDLQQSFDAAEKELANVCLELLQTRAKGEFLVEVSGEVNRPYWESFAAKGFKGLQSVSVETISPMMRSPAGRYEFWQAVSQVPPHKQAAVRRGLEFGDWSGLFDEESAGDMRLIRERELLMSGSYVAVNACDKHEEHVPDHWATYEMLEAADPTIPLMDEQGQPVLDPMGQPMNKPGGKYEQAKKACLDHIMRHRQAWQYIDPGTAMLLGRPLPPPILGTPTGDMQMATGGQPAATPQQQGTMPQDAAPGGAAPQAPQGPPAQQNPAGEQPQQPKPAEPAEPPQQGAQA